MSPTAHTPPWRQTLRIRVTVIASLAITAAIMAGALLMYRMQMNSVRRTVDDQLRTYGTQITQSAERSGWPPVLPPSTLDSNAQAQVLGAHDTVLAATAMLKGQPAIYALAQGTNVPVRRKAADAVIPADVQVIATRATVAGQPVVILTGTQTGLLENVSEQFARHLLIGFPVVLTLSAAGVWLIVGRALRPVERIRRAVTDITSADLSRRVPDRGSQDEIGMLARTMNDMLARLERSAQRQRRFVADASHELRSPLAALRTTLEVAMAHPDRVPWPAIVGRASEQAVRLEGLLQQLLLLAKADEGLSAADREAVDVAGLLFHLRSVIVTGGVLLEIRADGNPVVLGDPASLSRLFRNIIDNALRHAANVVKVTATATPVSVVVEIADDGPGIPPDQRERVFDRFVRLDGSRTRTAGGSGLGLAIALEIATAHQGKIVIADAECGGARVVATLPAANEHRGVPWHPNRES